MREILFRGKRMDNGEWAIGGFCEMDGSVYIAKGQKIEIVNAKTRETTKAKVLDTYEVAPATVGQFTGLTDRNGKRIFEGDIVHYLYEPGKGYWNSDQNSVIEWLSTGFFMRGIMGTNKYACSTGWLVSTPHGDGKCFEVIGNIHDNPELLEGG